MKVAIFSTKPYDKAFLEEAAAASNEGHELHFFEPKLDAETAPLANGCDAVCGFVNDRFDREALQVLAEGGVRFIAMRCAGFNNIDLDAARELEIGIGRVPAYSPFAVAEHAMALILTLNRKIHRAYNRVREGNFALQGLLGFDLHGKTIGVVGTGKIGVCFVRIALGFGCKVLAFDPVPNPEVEALGAESVELDDLLRRADIASLHVPLLPTTQHMINAESLALMKPGAMLINTSRGALIDTRAVIDALKSGRLGALGVDVYEEEGPWFFEDHSHSEVGISDDVLTRLLAFPNVIVTGHQAFFTREALSNIAATTIGNLSQWAREGKCDNAVE